MLIYGCFFLLQIPEVYVHFSLFCMLCNNELAGRKGHKSKIPIIQITLVHKTIFVNYLKEYGLFILYCKAL